jgi:hypothetical protein
MTSLLHMMLVPQVRLGLDMMKFSLNHPHRFHGWLNGFMSGLMLFGVSVVIELLTAINLTYAQTVTVIIYQYIYFSSIASITTVFATPLKNEALCKIASMKPVALQIDRTTSSKNSWADEKYIDDKFARNFTGFEIPDKVYD